MSTRSSTRNLFPPLDNPELTTRRRPRVDPTLLNDFEMATNENGDDVPPPGGGGTFMKRRPEECYDLTENMTADLMENATNQDDGKVVDNVVSNHGKAVDNVVSNLLQPE
nr:hypothetical protein [Tanacetum cinerariifolium]